MKTRPKVSLFGGTPSSNLTAVSADVIDQVMRHVLDPLPSDWVPALCWAEVVARVGWGYDRWNS